MSASLPLVLGRPARALDAPLRRAAPASRRRHPWRVATAMLLVILALGLLVVRADASPRTQLAPAPISASASPAPAAGSSVGRGSAAAAVTALVTAPAGQDPLAAVPSDFASVMGYTPVATRMGDGTLRLAKPTGACSVPGGGAPFGFERACKVHDYGYDLLRYAHATGQQLTAEARRQLDAMFGHDLRAGRQSARDGLAAVGRNLVVEVFIAGVTFNSWRQQYGNPATESLPGAALGLVVPVLAVPFLAGLSRRRAPAHGARDHGAGSRVRRGGRLRALADGTPLVGTATSTSCGSQAS